MDLYDGGLRAIDADGNMIFDHVDNQDYLRLHRRRGAALVLHEVPLHQVASARRTAGTAWARWPASTPATSSTPRGRGGARGVHGPDERQAQQRHHGLPLGPDDRDAALDREDRGAPARPGSPGRGPGREGRAPARGGGHPRGSARHALPPLPGGRERPGGHGQPDRLHDEQQRADEPGGGVAWPRSTSPGRRSPRAAEPRRGRDPGLRPVPVAARRTPWAGCRSWWTSWTRTAPCSTGRAGEDVG